MKTYKAFLTMLILVFSLSPCSVKRDVLSILDIQYISGLNKVKITFGSVLSCNGTTENSTPKSSVSKTNRKHQNREFSLPSDRLSFFIDDADRFSSYSGKVSGNSPPKYILFKRLKLHLG
ncbi:hypothetical protein [Chryseobacterium sp. 2987]|uniref:hypothetical protein n=1 Tax=Chryseobacterium sp. 2987 TaxID=2817767 RepID=UPI00285831BF|nr:hypothetical protein [Chryseobacterium sp. 2987]MDR6919439.1 hypothetical protein [Chryseobacterium sp. 2987]